MKRPILSRILTIVLVLGSILLPKTGYSQRASQWNNNIALDVGVDFAIMNTFHGHYEFKFTPFSSWNVRANYVTKSTVDQPTTALGFGGGFRFYMLDSRALSG